MTEKSSTEIVLEAVEDIHAQEQVVTRETLAEWGRQEIAGSV